MSKHLICALIIVYIPICALCFYEGQVGKGLYWLGAIILTVGVAMMEG